MPINKTPVNDIEQPHGMWEIYFENGELSCKGLYVNGLQHGLHESYWLGGRIHYI